MSILVAIALLIVTTCYIASVALFWRTNSFADGEALRFVFVNRHMLLAYLLQAEALFLAMGLMMALTIFILFCFVLWRRRAPSYPHASRKGRSLFGIAILIVTCDFAFVLWLPAPQQDPKISPVKWWQRSSLRYELESHASPLISLCVSILNPKNLEVEGDLDEHELGPPRSSSVLQPRSTADGNRSVILIAIESLRHDVIAASHQGREVMPHLNRLAKTGRLFTRAYSQSTHSDYADPCLVSSQYPLRSSRHHYYTPDDPWPKTLIYDVLKPVGYQTAIFSSQNEDWGHMSCFLDSPQLDVFFDSRQLPDRTHHSDKDGGFTRFVEGANTAGKLDDAITISHACRWIRDQASSNNPFFIYLNLQSSHFPYEIRKDRHVFQPCEIDFDASFASYPEDKVDVVRNAYFNALRYIDDQLGELLKVLEETGLKDHILLVIAGDNGEAFYENGYPTHAGPPFEEAIHVALLMHCPDRLPPAVDPVLTQSIDICPTILGLLKVPSPPTFQGLDLLNHDRADLERRPIFIHCQSVTSNSDAVICNSGWKYVHDRREDDSQLHNLWEDHPEQNNLVDKEPEVAKVLSDILNQWRRRQLLYYQSQRYYGFYYSPPSPTLDESAASILVSRQKQVGGVLPEKLSQMK